MTRQIRTLAVLGILCLVIGAEAQSASADHGRDSVTGHVVLFFNDDIDFTARSSAMNTDVSGRFRVTFMSVDPNFVAEGEVLCMRVVAGIPALFSIGGVITRAPAGSTAQGFTAVGSDSGKFGTAADTFNYSFSPVPVTVCPTPSLGSPVADGEIVIHNTLP
jgi:hypothetical protein